MIEIRHGDCRELLKELPDSSVDSVVTDPPYEYGFMNQRWDGTGVAFEAAVWEEVFRVLKPGGHLISFGADRRVHRLMCAIEDSGFDLRTMGFWVSASCLSDDTEVLVDGEWVSWLKAKTGASALCYDVERDEFSWQPIGGVHVFWNSDPLYRLVSDRTDQLVTGNHRCLVERDGAFVFVEAGEAARQPEARVPVLEDVRGLLRDLSYQQQERGAASDVFDRVFEPAQTPERAWWPSGSDGGPQGHHRGVRSVRGSGDHTEGVGCEVASPAPLLFQKVPRKVLRTKDQGEPTLRAVRVDGGVVEEVEEIPSSRRASLPLEGRVLTLEEEVRVGQVREVPQRSGFDGTQGRVRDGAPAPRGPSGWSAAGEDRGGPPHQSRRLRQQDREPGLVQVERGAQTVRGEGRTVADLVRFERVAYEGIVWCLTVPTGAFVVRRKGKVFVTGNSFPKSLNVAKAIDKKLGKLSEREVVGTYQNPSDHPDGGKSYWQGSSRYDDDRRTSSLGGITGANAVTAAATPEAALWEGWGTALKNQEPWVLFRKPLCGTVAENILKHGVGGLYIDGCRIPFTHDRDAEIVRTWPRPNAGAQKEMSPLMKGWDAKAGEDSFNALGRWPSAIICSDEDMKGPVIGVEVFGEARNPGPSSRGSADSRLIYSKGLKGGKRFATDGGDMDGVFGPYTKHFRIGGQEDQAIIHALPEELLMRLLPTGVIHPKASTGEREMGLEGFKTTWVDPSRKEGSAGRNNPRAGAGRQAKRKNLHPTVKPIGLMRHLVRMVTPPDGLVLDPFCGVASTGVAAVWERMRFLGMELTETEEKPYVSIGRARLTYAQRRHRTPEITHRIAKPKEDDKQGDLFG